MRCTLNISLCQKEGTFSNSDGDVAKDTGASLKKGHHQPNLGQFEHRNDSYGLEPIA